MNWNNSLCKAEKIEIEIIQALNITKNNNSKIWVYYDIYIFFLFYVLFCLYPYVPNKKKTSCYDLNKTFEKRSRFDMVKKKQSKLSLFILIL